MKIYTYKINEITKNQKQQIIDIAIKKNPIKYELKRKRIIDILKKILNHFIGINDDLFIGCENNKIIGYAFVCTRNDSKKEIKFLTKIGSIFQGIDPNSYEYHYLQNFYHEIMNIQPTIKEINFKQKCLVTMCQILNYDDQHESINWFIRNLLNYYLLQDKNKILFYKLNKQINETIKQYCSQLNIKFNEISDGLEIVLNHTLINKFDYINFTLKNVYKNCSFKFNNLNVDNMWTKKYISPVHPENNIIMIHGVNSYGYTFINLVPFLLNFGNVILLDLPIHRDSKAKSFLNTEWNMTKYALFLSKWIKEKNLKNIYLYGHSMGGGIVAILNILLYKRVKGLIIEDGYNGYCSIINQQIISMTKSLIKSIKAKKELDKQKNLKKSDYYLSFFEVYKPITKKTIKFFLNLFVPDILLNVDDGYLLNLKESLAIYGVKDGVVNAQEAQQFFKYLGQKWNFKFIDDATHSAHEDNLKDLKHKVCEYLSSITNIEYKNDFELNNIKTITNIGSPYKKKIKDSNTKFSHFCHQVTKK